MHAAKQASRAGLGVLRLWTTDAGTFPVLFCAGTAAALCTFTAVRAVTSCPDVRVSKDRRRNALSFSKEDGNEWRAKRFKLANLERNPLNQSRQFDSLFAKEENQDILR